MTEAAAPSLEAAPGISPHVYNGDDFRAVAALIHAEAGIQLPPGKMMLVFSRLSPLVRGTGMNTFAAYIDLVRTDDAERARAVSALTTNHTFFFREAHHFEHFARQVRPALVDAIAAGRRIRLWSAGCSSGEEVWSLVMTLLGENLIQGRQIATRDVRVLASDLSADVLQAATLGRYLQEDINAAPQQLRRNWTEDLGAHVAIGPDPHRITRFRTLNLHGRWPFSQKFDTIFCRNVMIYFGLEAKERLLERFAAQLQPGGHLYIGHSERVTGPAAALLDQVGPTIYRRSEAA